VGLLSDYANQAESYDRTRSASSSVLGPLRKALSGAPGPLLADIGGGTGNYSEALKAEGWEPLVVDASEEMLERARGKGLRTLCCNAQDLPLEDDSFDAVMLVSMLHHVDDAAAALSEARRILRPGGRLAVITYTREDIADLWLLDYFPVSRTWMAETHQPLEEIMAQLPGATRLEVRFEDLEDASLAALASYPHLILDPRWRRQTSYFERMERDHPGELQGGLERLRSDIEAGRGPKRPGRASVIAWGKEDGRPGYRTTSSRSGLSALPASKPKTARIPNASASFLRVCAFVACWPLSIRETADAVVPIRAASSA
jgi:ubiquinone/menaquinone biosynthesis C-methylase UbiE